MSQEQIVVRKPSFLSSVSPQEDVLALLDQLDELAGDTKLFMGKLWGMDDDQFHVLINKIRASLPDDLRRANRVVNDSDIMIASAREEAKVITEQAIEESNRIMDEARQMASRLVDTSEINKLAKAQAQEIMANAEANAREIKRGADEYARDVLSSIENHLARVMGTLQKGREKLEVRISAQQDEEPIIQLGRGIRR